jgi:UTP-glucose-1-phosphate uridylyltransferase
MQPTLVILAAGIGSRYKGLKQLDAVGPSGETIMDYSIYDAAQAGFGKVVFIIREEIRSILDEHISKTFGDKIETAFAYQKIDALPAPYSAPAERTKPWGTGHATLLTKDLVTGPFAVINADDFYGRPAFETLSSYLVSADAASSDYCLVGFRLEDTVSEYGTVARGICSVDDEAFLTDLVETRNIRRSEESFTSDTGSLTGNETASMNLWGFTPSLFKHLETGFETFLAKNVNDPKAEYFLPEVVGELIKSKQATAKVLNTNSKWLGMTYREDKPILIDEIQKMIDAGIYPNNLWK